MFTRSIHRNIVFTGALTIACASSTWAQDSAATQDQPEAAQPGRQANGRAERQATGQSDERRTVGTVSSVGRGSIVVRTEQGRHVVYTIGPGTARARRIAAGDRVTVVTLANDTDEAPTALSIAVVPRAQGLAATPENAEPDNVPQQVRTLESQIERQARKYRAGLQAGAALDPELISLDAFATLGPLFNRNIHFRPNVEFAFGELTTLFGIHLDALYTLPGVTRSIRWAPYVGGGPTFSFSHQGFEGDSSNAEIATTTGSINVDNGRFDFSNYEWHNGVNFIVGARNQNGTFFEMKSTAWGAANIRLMAGFEF